jgi:hypothetical protein
MIRPELKLRALGRLQPTPRARSIGACIGQSLAFHLVGALARTVTLFSAIIVCSRWVPRDGNGRRDIRSQAEYRQLHRAAAEPWQVTLAR